MNDLRVDCKQRFWEKRFNGLIIPPEVMLCKSQCHDDWDDVPKMRPHRRNCLWRYDSDCSMLFDVRVRPVCGRLLL